MKSSAPLAYYDHDASFWRTSQASLLAMMDASSDVFSGPWPRSGTMRNGVCYPQPTLVRPTSESGSGSWPTPDATNRVRDEETLAKCAAFRLRNANQKTVPLYLAEVAINWATPTVDDANNVTRTSGSQQSLARDTFQWATTTWPTPQARDYKGESGAGRQERRDDPTDTLPNAVSQWATPAAHEGRLGFQDRSRGMQGSQESITTQAMCFTGDTPSASKAQTAPSDSSPAKPRRAGLNPRFGLWLMGYPAAWLDSVESATASSPRARTKSSAPSKGESL
jgi:hypothetical protein